MFIDAIGKACPMPVVMAKKELDGGCRDLTIAVDNKIAVENLTRLAAQRGMQISTEEKGGMFYARISGEGHAVEANAPVYTACTPAGCGYAVFVGKDHVGEGAYDLGYNLMKMALYTFSQSDDIPAYVLFMNSGVKLPAGEEQQVIDSLNALTKKGTEILVCGTCLNYYGLAEQLRVGKVSNMYDILTCMQKSAKVITL